MNNIRITHAKKPTKKHLQDDLENIQDRKWKLDRYFEKLEEVFGPLAGGDFYDHVWWIFEDYCKEVANKHGIDNEDLSWFIYELDCGNESDTIVVNAGGKNVTIKVEDIDSFIDFLSCQ